MLTSRATLALATALTILAAGCSPSAVAPLPVPFAPSAPTELAPIPSRTTAARPLPIPNAQAEPELMPTRSPPLAVGTVAPEVALIDQRGQRVSVNKALEAGPVALIFYRGRW